MLVELKFGLNNERGWKMKGLATNFVGWYWEEVFAVAVDSMSGGGCRRCKCQGSHSIRVQFRRTKNCENQSWRFSAKIELNRKSSFVNIYNGLFFGNHVWFLFLGILHIPVRYDFPVCECLRDPSHLHARSLFAFASFYRVESIPNHYSLRRWARRIWPKAPTWLFKSHTNLFKCNWIKCLWTVIKNPTKNQLRLCTQREGKKQNVDLNLAWRADETFLGRVILSSQSALMKIPSS